MKILNVKAHNVMRLKDVDFDLEGHHLFLVGGKNGNGKTSVIKSVLMALCGKRACEYPEKPLRDGETSGFVRIDLSGDEDLHDTVGFSVELRFRRKRNGEVLESFRVLDSTGEESPEPRDLLSRLFKLRAFDPLEFERKKPKEQVQLLKDMLGLDFEHFDKKREKTYLERTECGREGKRLAGKFDSMSKPEKPPKELVVVAKLLGELQSEREANEIVDKLEKDLAAEIDAGLEAKSNIKKYEEQILELQKKIEAAKDCVLSCAKNVASMKDMLKCKPKKDLSEIESKIANAETENEKFRQHQQWLETKKELESERLRYQTLTEEIESIDKAKQEAITNAPWPVPGMSLDEEGVILNCQPLMQASQAERFLASTKIGMALNPKLRLLVSQSGSDLDTESIEALSKILEENDFQMICEVVTRSESDEAMCAVVIEDGEVK